MTPELTEKLLSYVHEALSEGGVPAFVSRHDSRFELDDEGLVDKLKNEVSKLSGLTMKEKDAVGTAYINEQCDAIRKQISESVARRDGYQKDINELALWSPPTHEHQWVKNNLLSRLNSNAEANDISSHVKSILFYESKSPFEGYELKLSNLIGEVEWAQAAFDKACKFVETSNRWLEILETALNQPKENTNGPAIHFNCHQTKG